jgi:hypothetical protein
MEYLELKVLPESPTLIMNDRDEILGSISVNGVGEVLQTRTNHIARAINGYTILLDAFIEIFAELDRDEIAKAKHIASEAYYKATKGVKYG